MQYGVPVAIPVVLALALAPFMAATVATSTSLAPIASTDAPARVNDLAKVPANAVVDDSAFRPVAPAMPPVVGSTTSDSSDEASSSEEGGASSVHRSSSPEGSVSGADAASTSASSVASVGPGAGDEPAEPPRCAKKKFGLCALGKWTRQDLFHSTDSLGGF